MYARASKHLFLLFADEPRGVSGSLPPPCHAPAAPWWAWAGQVPTRLVPDSISVRAASSLTSERILSTAGWRPVTFAQRLRRLRASVEKHGHLHARGSHLTLTLSWTVDRETFAHTYSGAFAAIGEGNESVLVCLHG